jgi:Ran GTPase-activating protein (RanGAP) involved in mRNA processing and transport
VNRTLQELAVDGTNPSKGSVSLLGDAMLKNPQPALEVINLRGIKISDEESLRMGLGLAGYKHFLTGLDVSGCGLTGRSVTGVFAGLAANKNICTYLRVFKVSRNKLGGGQGTVELARFFDRFAIGNEPRSLEELCMSECNLDAIVISALVRRDGVVATLKEIDLSHNILSGSIGASLTAMAKDSQCLRRVNISNTRVDVESIESFLKALTANEFLDDLEIDLSHNLLRIHGADAIDRGLRAPGALQKIKALNLYNTGLNEDGLQVVVKVLENASKLEELDIGANVVKARGGKNVQSFLTALSVFVTKHQSLRVLRMGGQVAGKLYLGKYVGPFLAVFASTRKIEELDVAGNQMGDDGICMLAEALRMNRTLK